MQKLLAVIFFLTIAWTLLAQTMDEMSDRFEQQLNQYPHEKIYLQTDKPTYLSGEQVWFRSHMVEATTHLPAFFSRYVYVELFNPFDQLIKRVKIRPDSLGVYAGHLDLDDDLPEGNYTMRAYTRYMRNQGNEHFFKKTIQVLDPFSLQIEPIPTFDINGNKVNVSFKFLNPASGDTITPEVVELKLVDETSKTISPKNKFSYNWNFTLNKKRDSRNLLLSIVHNGRKYNKFYPIPYDINDFDITFHPEGGYIVPGQRCQVGFKAINPSGLSEEVSGTLYNSKEEEVATFASIQSGMGFFNFLVDPNETYYALCKTKNSDPKRVDLPLPDLRARTISAKHLGEERFMVSMLKGEDAPNDPVSLLIHHKGIVYFHQPWEDQSKVLSFVSDNFPTGIITILLLNSQNEILSERLIFNHNKNDFASLKSEMSSPSYKRRGLVSLQLQLADADTIAMFDNIAVSVTDKNAVRQDTTSNLLATLLLSSELNGYIESPANYFNEYGIVDRNGLDALMLTQGWRRYDIPALLQGQIATPDQFAPEQYQEISGKSELLFGDLKQGEISLIATLDTLTSGETTTADEKGRFVFKVEYPENTEITIQSLSKRGGKHNLINIDPIGYPDFTYSTIPSRVLSTGQVDIDIDAYMKLANEEYAQKYGIRTIMLDEVKVTANKMDQIKESSYFSPIYSTGLVTADDIEKRKVSSLRSLLVATPGLIVKPDMITTSRSDVPVMYIIDDVPQEHFFDQIDMLDVSAIDNLFVMKDNIGLLGHFPNTNGAIVITTKRGFVQKNVKSMNIDRITPLGYQPPAEFYAPAYETQEQRDASKPDLRTTIYWKPNVQFSSDGEALLEFYAADTPTTYQIIGEGVTSAGKIIRWEKEVTIERTIE